MNGVRLVRDAVIRPGRCAFITYMASNREPRGFFDFGTELFGEHVYCSMTAFQEMANVAGYVPATRTVDTEAVALRAELEQVRAELADRDEQLAAVETLKRAGFAPARKPGRPKGSAKREPAGVA